MRRGPRQNWQKHLITFRNYNKSGFIIKKLHVDPEFEPLKQQMMGNNIEVNIASTQERVPEIERAIRTIKERYRALYHRVPYKSMPKIMIKAAAREAVKWLNMFLPKGRVSHIYSPRAIVLGKPIEYQKHCTISFGSYV